jgi:hypothetical protein
MLLTRHGVPLEDLRPPPDMSSTPTSCGGNRQAALQELHTVLQILT